MDDFYTLAQRQAHARADSGQGTGLRRSEYEAWRDHEGPGLCDADWKDGALHAERRNNKDRQGHDAAHHADDDLKEYDHKRHPPEG